MSGFRIARARGGCSPTRLKGHDPPLINTKRTYHWSNARIEPGLIFFPRIVFSEYGHYAYVGKQRDTVEKGSKSQLQSLRSRLLIRAVPADDGQQFSCRGHHPALKTSSALVATIQLSVLCKYVN